MNYIPTIHFGLAYLVGLCALVFSWNSLGRRVMNVVLGLQFLAGLVLAGTFGAQHLPLPPALWLHLTGSLAALIAYALARRLGDRPGGGRAAMLLSIAGLLCVAGTIYVGLHMAGTL